MQNVMPHDANKPIKHATCHKDAMEPYKVMHRLRKMTVGNQLGAHKRRKNLIDRIGLSGGDVNHKESTD